MQENCTFSLLCRFNSKQPSYALLARYWSRFNDQVRRPNSGIVVYGGKSTMRVHSGDRSHHAMLDRVIACMCCSNTRRLQAKCTSHLSGRLECKFNALCTLVVDTPTAHRLCEIVQHCPWRSWQITKEAVLARQTSTTSHHITSRSWCSHSASVNI